MDSVHIDLKELKSSCVNIKILYVEDSVELRDKMGIFLEKIFTSVTTAQNGIEALEFFKNSDYDLVITDIQMPQMDGMELSRELKNINPDQEIIIVSAFTDSEYFTESIRLGVSGYIIKPIDFNQILSVISQTVKKINIVNENSTSYTLF